ncbi:bifunctional phosphoribosyl-AMP cyclohydrolase/phosphoribosyl-ATP diphosphatase HisIE [Lentibacillus kimchii]|uniref:Histidine biosynthesis bifunctional protein HisIE n=1 Tax=Lentibacillus kimchii TaxID=1542911 RepID=A0ABW2UVH0_9BACI
MMPDTLQFDENGLLPAIIQDARDGRVLTLAYMNRTALDKTLETGETWLFSRTRQTLWHKGETSGNTQTVKHIAYDCDQDALLVQVEPLGPACHTGEMTCFHQSLYAEETPEPDVVTQLVQRIHNRHEKPAEGTYTNYLFQEGIDKILKKVGEETSEVIIGAKNQDTAETTWEIADLTYHTLVLMEVLGISVADIKRELYRRQLEKEGDERV